MRIIRMMVLYPWAPDIWLSIRQKNTIRRWVMNVKKVFGIHGPY